MSRYVIKKKAGMTVREGAQVKYLMHSKMVTKRAPQLVWYKRFQDMNKRSPCWTGEIKEIVKTKRKVHEKSASGNQFEVKKLLIFHELV